MDPRSQLTARLSTELDDPDGARSVVAAMDDAAVAAAEALADGDIAGSPWLSYRPSTVPVDEIDSLWVFSYGFRFADPAADPVGLGGNHPRRTTGHRHRRDRMGNARSRTRCR